MGRPYTVTDALRDGVVKPIHWQPRVTDWQLYGAKLDVAFKREFGHLPEEEQNKLVTEAVHGWMLLLYHPKRIEQIADDVARALQRARAAERLQGNVVCKDKEAVAALHGRRCASGLGAEAGDGRDLRGAAVTTRMR